MHLYMDLRKSDSCQISENFNLFPSSKNVIIGICIFSIRNDNRAELSRFGIVWFEKVRYPC